MTATIAMAPSIPRRIGSSSSPPMRRNERTVSRPSRIAAMKNVRWK
jgi:hypothetical protein